MKHETYWVVVATLIPVLAIASALELRVLFDRIKNNAMKKDLSPEAWYFLFQALVTAALLLTLPAVMGSIYDGTEPGAFFGAAVRMGIPTTAALLVVGPVVEGIRTARMAERVKPRSNPKDGDGHDH